MPEMIWIKTTPSNGGFVVTLEINEDTAETLTPTMAMAYAEGLLTVVQRAEYDAAVNKQMFKVTGDKLAAAQIVQDLRRDRPAAPQPTALRFEPGVSQRSGRPFIHIYLKDEIIGQWELRDARGHALHVIEAVAGADLDRAYLLILKNLVGLDDTKARVIVEELGQFRESFRFTF